MTWDAVGLRWIQTTDVDVLQSAVQQGPELQRVEDQATGGAFPHRCAQLPRHLISLPLPPSAESDLSASQKPGMYRDAHI